MFRRIEGLSQILVPNIVVMIFRQKINHPNSTASLNLAIHMIHTFHTILFV